MNLQEYQADTDPQKPDYYGERMPPTPSPEISPRVGRRKL